MDRKFALAISYNRDHTEHASLIERTILKWILSKERITLVSVCSERP